MSSRRFLVQQALESLMKKKAIYIDNSARSNLGQDESLMKQKAIDIDNSARSVLGQDESLMKEKAIDIDNSARSVLGQDESLMKEKAIDIDNSARSVLGQDESLMKEKAIDIDNSARRVLGQDESLMKEKAIDIDNSARSVLGQDESLMKEKAIDIDNSVRSVLGQDESLMKEKAIDIDNSARSVLGQDESLMKEKAIDIDNTCSARRVLGQDESLMKEKAIDIDNSARRVLGQDESLMKEKAIDIDNSARSVLGQDESLMKEKAIDINNNDDHVLNQDGRECFEQGSNYEYQSNLNQSDNEQSNDESNNYIVVLQDGNEELNRASTSNMYTVSEQGSHEDLNYECYDRSDFNDKINTDNLIELEIEMIDTDDDITDPDWEPPKKRKRNEISDASTSESETECESLNVNSHKNVKEIQNYEAVVEATVDHEEIIQGTESPMKTKRGKPGRPQPKLWVKNVNKHLRMTGKGYKGIATNENGQKSFCKDRSERILGDKNCSKRCSKRTCCETIDESQRRTIFDEFWEMNWDEKKTYVISMVDVCIPKSGNGTRRKQTMRYTLISKGIKVPVCKNMFLSTLGIGEFTVYSWIKAKNEGERGKRREPKQESEAKAYARDFLKGLPKLPSHYCRASTSKLYLEPDFQTITQLYNFYTEHCSQTERSKISYKTFSEIFTDLNLALFHPKKDQCDTCCAHQTGNITEEQYSEHIKRKEEARKEKSEDKNKALSDKTVKVITLDLQSVLLSPRLKASALYYKTKLACHNYTVFDMSSKQLACYFWHEGVFGLSADAFASCIHDYISNIITTGLEEIVIYSDGCCYQNRNVTVANTLLLLAMKHNILTTQKYLEKGHTQMEVDSVHSTIERKLRNRDIYVPADYVTCIKAARLAQPYDVKYLAFDFFRTFSVLRYYTSIRPGLNTGAPVVTDLRVLRYCSNGTIEYKLKFTDEFSELPKRVTRGALPTEEDVPIAANAPAKIKDSKYHHLQQLKSVLPQDYHGFYDALLHEK